MSCTSIDCGFSCNQSPLRIDGKSDITDLSGVQQQFPTGNGNATARLWSIHPGNGQVSHDDDMGVMIGYQPQDTFTFYGISYTLFDIRIFYGQHVLFPLTDVSGQCNVPNTVKNGKYTAAPLEVYCFFKNTKNQFLCLVLPIGIGDGVTQASSYISALGSNTCPPLSTLFQDLLGGNTTAFNAKNMVLHYTGQDVRKYYYSGICDPTSFNNPVQYLFIMNDIKGKKKISSTISLTVYNKFIKILNDSKIIPYLTLPDRITGITSADRSKLKFLPANSLYITNTIGGENSISVNSLKCYPINPKKDIKNKRIYLDEKGRPTNLECPSDAFTFFQNNGKNYCCNGDTSTNTCSTASDANTFCGLDPSPVDPSTGNPIQTCDELKEKLNNSAPPSNFLTSPAGIETIIAIVIAGSLGLGILSFLLYMYVSKKPTSAAAAAAVAGPAAAAAGPAAAAAGPAAAAAGPAAAAAAAAGPGRYFSNKGIIILIGLLATITIAFIILLLFYLGIIETE